MTRAPLAELLHRIHTAGGFVNAHSHLDRAWTVTTEDLKTRVYAPLREKWELIDAVKRASSEENYFNRMQYALSLQQKMGTKACLTFVDCDAVAEERALKAAQKLRDISESEMGITLRLAVQTLKGVCTPEARTWFERAVPNVDVIGGLPGADRGREEEHLDILLSTAKSTNKRVHVHVDQNNSPTETETELLAKKTIQWGMEGKVSAVHGISLAAHPMEYRRKVYALCKDAALSFVACPSAWIDARRNEILTPTHNAVTPIDELVEFGIPVAIGSDNIADLYKPFVDGNMETELRILLESTHFYNIDELTKVATLHGRFALGLKSDNLVAPQNATQSNTQGAAHNSSHSTAHDAQGSFRNV